jgi:hypothetical protein
MKLYLAFNTHLKDDQVCIVCFARGSFKKCFIQANYKLSCFIFMISNSLFYFIKKSYLQFTSMSCFDLMNDLDCF